MPRFKQKDRTLLAHSFSGRGARLLSVRGLGLMALAALTIPVLFFGGEYVQRYITYHKEFQAGRSQRQVTLSVPLRDMALNTIYELPRPWWNEKLLQTGLPIYDLRLAPKHLKKLQATAELVTARGSSTGIRRDYVPAEFWIDGGWLPIEVKLRGLTYYHYLKKRPSLRLKFPKERLFEGKREINLTEPYDKKLAVEVTTNWEAEQHGLLTWDSRFVILRVNGDVLGLFQEIEQFGPSIADRTGRSEGYIFSGHGQLFGKEGAAFDKATQAIELVKQCYASEGAPAAAHCGAWEFVSGYFDTDRWAWAAALTALLKSRHAWAADNLRLFWDPARGKFEPIPWDYLFYTLDPALDGEGEADYSGSIAEPFLSIPEFRRMRDQRLWILLTERIDKMIEQANGLFDALLEVLRYDVRHLSLDLDIMRHTAYVNGLRNNQKLLMALFRKHNLRAQFWQDATGLLTVELWNYGKSFLSVTSMLIEYENTSASEALKTPVVVDGYWQHRPGRALFSVAVPQAAKAVRLHVQDGVTGAVLAENEISVQHMAGDAPKLAPPPARLPLELFLENVHVGAAQVTFGPGTVELDGVLEIPSSYDVVFAPGLDLKMGGGAALIIYGNLTSVGSETAPIRVSGQQPNTAWGGLFVQGTRVEPASVRLEHTIIEGGSGGQNQRTWFTGSLAVHDGVVVIKSSEFRNGAAIDGINLKNVRVLLQDNVFRGSKIDAVDCDFCTGQLIGNRVIDAGGDALDFSGSDVTVAENIVANCGDKGMSIGERTTATIERNTITGCYTGIAVKDDSDATIRHTRLSQLQVGIALYVKKLSFGPSRARLDSVDMADVVTDFLHESSCTLEILRPTSTLLSTTNSPL